MAITYATGVFTASGTNTEVDLQTALDANPANGMYESGAAIFRGASLTLAAGATLTLNRGEVLCFDNTYRLNAPTGTTVDFVNGGGIVYNGNVGNSFFNTNVKGRNVTLRANAVGGTGRADYFSPQTTSDGLTNLRIAVGGGAGFTIYTHLEGLAGKINGLEFINDATATGINWLVQFGSGTYTDVRLPSPTSLRGFAVNLQLYMPRSGGNSRMVRPVFAAAQANFIGPAIVGTFELIDETWTALPAGTVGPLVGSSTGIDDITGYRKITWSPGTLYDAANPITVRLTDSQATPTVYRNGTVTSAAGIELTWAMWKRLNSVQTNYGPFNLLARRQDLVEISSTETLVQPTTRADIKATDSYWTADGSLVAGVAVDATAKTVTITASRTIDNVYDYMKYWLALPANMTVSNMLTTSGTRLTFAGGWAITVSGTGVVLSEGTKLRSIFTDSTVSMSGGASITAVYGSSAGVSTSLELRGLKAGCSYIVANNSTKATIKFGSNASVTSDTVYFPPGSAGTAVYVARQTYGDNFDYEVIPLSEGSMWYQFIDVADEGITNGSLTSVQAYTAIENTNKLYDYIAAYRLTEAGIKLGNIVQRAGTQLQFGDFSGVVNQSAGSVFSVTGATITIKATGLSGTGRYNTIIATPPASWTANTNEVMNVEIEDANGDSSVLIEASGISTFEIWKITDATNPDNYNTGTLLGTVGIGKYRFMHADGYKMVIRDQTTNFRVVSEMEKGAYTAALFFGGAVQLAQAPEVYEIKNNLALMQIDVDAIKGTGFATGTDSLKAIKTAIGTPMQAGSVVAANIVKVNDVTVTGTGQQGNEWGPSA